jgi:hypothetical protein
MLDWLKRVGPGRASGTRDGTVQDGAEPAALRPCRDVLAAMRDGTTVLLDLRREIYLTLDEAGTVIWQEVEQGADTDRICSRLAEEFDAPPAELRADAERFLADLRSRGLVVRA